MYGICNVVGASIPRNTDSGTYIHVGPEIGVASTKAFTGQVTVLMLLALCVGQMRGTVDDATVERIVRELKNMPLYIKDVLGLADKIKNLSKIYTYARNFLYLGRGYNYPTALEGALKLKEISYIHAEGYPAAEMKSFKNEGSLSLLLSFRIPPFHPCRSPYPDTLQAAYTTFSISFPFLHLYIPRHIPLYLSMDIHRSARFQLIAE